MKINYEDIKNKIKENCIKGLFFVTEYVDDVEKKEILSFILGRKEYVEEEISSLQEISSNGYRTYEYESTNIATNQTKKHFLVSKDDLPLLKLEHYQPKSSSIDYSEDSYVIYQDHNNRIRSKISITSLKKEDFEDINIMVLDSDELVSDGYYQKKYHFIIQDDEILSLRIGNDMFLNGEAGFSIRCENALKCIGKVMDKITQKIDNTLGDNVKEYHIKRHK